MLFLYQGNQAFHILRIFIISLAIMGFSLLDMYKKKTNNYGMLYGWFSDVETTNDYVRRKHCNMQI
jgi:hypothetical protein